MPFGIPGFERKKDNSTSGFTRLNRGTFNLVYGEYNGVPSMQDVVPVFQDELLYESKGAVSIGNGILRAGTNDELDYTQESVFIGGAILPEPNSYDIIGNRNVLIGHKMAYDDIELTTAAEGTHCMNDTVGIGHDLFHYGCSGNNVAIGSNVMNAANIGENNIGIGDNVNIGAVNLDGMVGIGKDITSQAPGSVTIGRSNSGGLVNIGKNNSGGSTYNSVLLGNGVTATADTSFHVSISRSTAAGSTLFFDVGTQEIRYDSSTLRGKENVRNSEFDCLAAVNALRLRDFTWKGEWEQYRSNRDGLVEAYTVEGEAGKEDFGLIAEEAAEVAERFALADGYGNYDNINSKALLFAALGAIQQLNERIVELEADVDALQNSN